MTREEFEYAIKSCGYFIYRGQTYYEESELIKAFEDMGLIEQEPKYCDRNICLKNECNGIGCDECEVTKSQEPGGDLISRQDAITAIDEKAKRIKNEDTLNGLAGAVGILFDLPSVTQKSETVTEFADRCRECGAKYGKLLKQQPCEDAISRQAVIDAIYDMEILKYRIDLENVIKALPSVKPQEKTGHWLMTGEIDVYYDLPSYECSKCGQTSLEEGDYCPNCGARMVEEQESEKE